MVKTGSKHISKLGKLADQELVEIAKSGSEKAYAELVSRYKESLTCFLDNFLISRNREIIFTEPAEEPQDICQEALHKAFKNLNSYNPQFSFSTWLYNIAQNTAIDYFRKRKLDVEFNSMSDYKITASGGNSENSPEDKLISNQIYNGLIDKINNLPDRYRQIARLRFIDEYAIEEIAVKLGLPANTVKTRIKRAKEQLFKQIDK